MSSRGSFVVLFASLSIAMSPAWATAEINTVVVRNDNRAANPEFKLRFVAPAAGDDAATGAAISIVDGRRDVNGGDVEKLTDGRLPSSSDQPAESFFFAAGTDGGRLLIDLGKSVPIDRVNTYSWHETTRAPQVYRLYGSDGDGDGFVREPKRDTDPEGCGWRRIAEVDTRPRRRDGNVREGGDQGGQYGVSIFDSQGPLGAYRYLLLDVSRTEDEDQFGNTFLGEIDVVAYVTPEGTVPDPDARFVLEIPLGDETVEATIDTSDTPDLTEWARKELAPVVKQWYPKIVELLPSDDYSAPRSFSITFSSRMRGVAAAGGTRVRCAADWFRRNLDGEAKGAVVHELVHVVQQYGRARRVNRDATRPPGWLVEGIPDYIRWFLYEPESRGAEISRGRLERVRYDDSYRVSANFLNWVAQQHGEVVVAKLNAAMRDGRYRESLWSDLTGRELGELGTQWKVSLERGLAEPRPAEATDGDAPESP